MRRIRNGSVFLRRSNKSKERLPLEGKDEAFWDKIDEIKGGSRLANYFLSADTALETRLWVFKNLDFLFGIIASADQSVIDEDQDFIMELMESLSLHNQTEEWRPFIAQLTDEKIIEIAKEVNPEKYTDPSVDPNELWVYPYHEAYVRLLKRFADAMRTLLDRSETIEGSKIVTETYGGPDVQAITEEIAERASAYAQKYSDLLVLVCLITNKKKESRIQVRMGGSLGFDGLLTARQDEDDPIGGVKSIAVSGAVAIQGAFPIAAPDHEDTRIGLVRVITRRRDSFHPDQEKMFSKIRLEREAWPNFGRAESKAVDIC